MSVPTCVHGVADEPDHCACPAKWEGRLCEIRIVLFMKIKNSNV